VNDHAGTGAAADHRTGDQAGDADPQPARPPGRRRRRDRREATGVRGHPEDRAGRLVLELLVREGLLRDLLARDLLVRHRLRLRRLLVRLRRLPGRLRGRGLAGRGRPGVVPPGVGMSVLGHC
jgi:hypothetical protein